MYPKSIRPLSSVEVRTCTVLLATVEVDHGYGCSIVASIVASSGVPFSMVGTGFHSFTFPPVVVWKRGSGPALGLTADRPQSDRAIARADHSSACIALEATPAGALLLNKLVAKPK